MATLVRSRLRFEQLEQRTLLSVSPLGEVLSINPSAPGDQRLFAQSRASAVACDEAGNFVAVWSELDSQTGTYDVYARRYAADGEPAGDAQLVNPYTNSVQKFAAVAIDDDGDFVVTWSSLNQDGSGYGVYARRYDAAGTPQDNGFRVNTHTSGNQNFSDVAMDDDGDFVVVWTSADQDGDATGVFAQRYSADGSAAGDEFRVNATVVGNQRHPVVAMNGDGDFVVAWTSQDQDGSGGGIYMRRFAADGSQLGGEARVNTTHEGNQQFPAIAAEDGGRFVMAWQSFDTASASWSVFAQAYDADARRWEGEINVGQGRNASVAMAESGDYVVAWQTFDANQATPPEIRVQHVHSLGLLIGDASNPGYLPLADQTAPSVALHGQQAIAIWSYVDPWGGTNEVGGRRIAVSAAGNLAPIFNAVADQVIEEQQTLTLDIDAVDPDDPPNQITYSLEPGAPEGATIDPQTGLFEWTTTEADGPGTYRITVRATDDGDPALWSKLSFDVDVTENNLPPSLEPIDDQAAYEGVALSLTVTASDADLPANTLSYSLAEGAPEGMSIDSATGEITWTPAESQGPGSYSVIVEVADDGDPALVASQSFTVTVDEVNVAPELDPVDEASVDQGGVVTLQIVATDADEPANQLTFSLGGDSPVGAEIDPQTGWFTWTTAADQAPGAYPIEVVVADDGDPSLVDTMTFTVTVEPALLEPIADVSIDEQQSLQVTLAASAPYVLGDDLVLALGEGTVEGVELDPAAGTISWTPTEAQGPGSYEVAVIATHADFPDHEDIERFTITVQEVNLAPVVEAIEDQAIDEGQTLVLDVVASDPDLPAQTLTYAFDTPAPEGMAIDPQTGHLSWTPDESQGPGSYEVAIRVSDDADLPLGTVTTFTVTVSEVNEPPAFDDVEDQFIDEGESFSLALTAVDPDDPPSTLIYALGEGVPDGATIDPATGLVQWTPSAGQGPGVYQFEATVADAGDPPLADTVTFTVSIESPILEPIADQAATEQQPLSFFVAMTPPHTLESGVTLSLETGSPAGAAIDSATGEFSWTPTETQGPGEYVIVVRATLDDGSGSTDTERFSVSVGEVNQAPSLDPVDNQTVVEGQALELSLVATDADQPTNTLSFSLADGAPTGMQIDPVTGVLTWTPTADQGPGDYTVEVEVVDDGSPALSDTVSFDVHVSEPGEPPQLDTIADQTIDLGQGLTLAVSASDPDTPLEGLTFSLGPDSPAGATIDPATGALNWAPTEIDQLGVHALSVTVAEIDAPERSATVSFDVTVEPALIAEIDDQGVVVGSALQINLVAEDGFAFGDGLQLAFQGEAPEGMVLDDQLGVISWTPTAAQAPGTYQVTLKASQPDMPDHFDTETFAITVNATNEPPTVEPVEMILLELGETLSTTIVASDPDGPDTALTFDLDENAPEGAAVDPQSGLLTWTPTTGQATGLYEFAVIVSDGHDPAAATTVDIAITVEAPVLDPIANQTVFQGQTLSLTLTATSPYVFSESLFPALAPGSPEGMLLEGQTGSLIWVVPADQAPGDYPVTVEVADQNNSSITDTETFVVTVMVSNNQSPLVDPIDDQTINEGEALVVGVSASDPDGPSDALTFSLEPGAPQEATVDAATGEFSWTPGEEYGPGSYTITVRVEDGGMPAASATTSFTVTVGEVNQPPEIELIADQMAVVGEELSLTIVATDPDQPEETLTFSLGPDAPEGATIDPATGVLRWTPNEDAQLTWHEFTVEVADSGSPSLTGSASFQVWCAGVSAEGVPDLGPVEFLQLPAIALATGDRFIVRPVRDGRLTLQAFFESAAGEFSLVLVDSQGVTVGASASGTDQRRVDATVTAGEAYELVVDGANPSVQLQATNLLTHSGGEVVVYGTDGDDTFSLVVGATHLLTVNDVPYNVDGAAINSIGIEAGAGDDAVSFVGSAEHEVVDIWTDHVSVGGETYGFTAADIESFSATSSDQVDAVMFYDSAGVENFEGRPGYARLEGVGFAHEVDGYYTIHAVSTEGGSDVADVYDSTADDTYTARPGSVQLEGSGYQITVEGYGYVRGHSTAGGSDEAYFHGSDGDDIFRFTPEFARLTGNGFGQRADGFATIVAYSSGGQDTAVFYDSEGDDEFVVDLEEAVLIGSEISVRAEGFESVQLFATGGGHDIARLKGSAGDDVLDADDQETRLYGADYFFRAMYFDEVYAEAGVGGDDAARFQDTPSDDLLEAAEDWVRLSNAQLGWLYMATGFSSVEAISIIGNDVADVDPAVDFLLLIGDWQSPS